MAFVLARISHRVNSLGNEQRCLSARQKAVLFTLQYNKVTVSL